MTLGTDAPETAEAVTNRLWELGAIGVVEETAARAVELRAFLPPGSDAASRAAAVRDYLDDVAALGLPGARGARRRRAASRRAVGGGVARPLPARAGGAATRSSARRGTRRGRRRPMGASWCSSSPGARSAPAVTGRPGAASSSSSGRSRAPGCLTRSTSAAGRASWRSPRRSSGSPGSTRSTWIRTRWPRRRTMPGAMPWATACTRRWRPSRPGAGPAAPLVLANLLAAAHVTHGADPRPAGRARREPDRGGLLAHEVPAVAGAFAAVGCWLVEVAEHEGWAAILVRRGG